MDPFRQDPSRPYRHTINTLGSDLYLHLLYLYLILVNRGASIERPFLLHLCTNLFITSLVRRIAI